MKRSLLVIAAVTAILGGHRPEHSQSALLAPVTLARGVVFNDANHNRKFDAGEEPLANIRVSNGREIVKTDKIGRYSIAVEDDTIVFVIKPSGWRTPLSKVNTPEFYYIHKPHGSPKQKYAGVKPTGDLPSSVDFPLYRQREPSEFKALLFGDPQPRDQKEIDYIAHDVVEELIGTDATFGVTLGDILFDDLSLFGSSSKTVALLGIPWYNVIGNHDINRDAKSDRHSDESFESHFGPAYYSFDYGKVHFVVLDNIEWSFDVAKKKGNYRAGLGKDQITFVKNDLADIPKDQMIVLLMHVPITEMHDRSGLFRLIENRPFCISVSGHTHHHEHRFVTKADGWQGAEPHHHIVNVTVSGSWWSGSPDERGIPHSEMADGAPNGYSILSFDGSEYRLDFKAAGRPWDHQMKIIAPETVAKDKLAGTDVFVNVFNGSEKSKVEMRLGNGEWYPMSRKVIPDPAFAKLSEAENKISKKTWRNLPKAKPSTHLWQARLPAGVATGTRLIQIRSTDMHGRTHRDERVIRVK